MDPAELHATKYYLLKMAIAMKTKIFDLTDFITVQISTLGCSLECEYIASILF